MRVVILTSSDNGTASHLLPYLISIGSCEIAMVVLSRGEISDKTGYYKRKLVKMFRIGLFGALNGMRMRKWFDQDLRQYAEFRNLEDICKENNIPFFITSKINCSETRELFKSANADLGISLGNGYIGQSVFTIPANGMINIHHELLPMYQNAQSVIWQIYNMSDKTGYTIHKIDKHIDTGEILYQEIIPIIFKETLAETVTSTCFNLLEASAKGLIYVIKNFQTLNKEAKPQGAGTSYTTPTYIQFLRIKRNFLKLKDNFVRKTGE